MTKARVDQPATADDLSEAARAVVRDAGDPRMDAHLRALGLAPDSADPPAETARPEAVESRESPELAVLRARVAELETALTASAGRVRMLVAALVVALVALAVLAVLLLAGAG